MFTGIVQKTGRIVELQRQGRAGRLTLECEPWATPLELGESIAVNGCCLTVARIDGRRFGFDVLEETFARTSIGGRTMGQRLNLERALTPDTRLGGHLVSGHVDGVGEIVAVKQLGRAKEYWIKAPDELAKYIAEKGSITVDGISLTVNAIDGAKFKLTIVPHTSAETTVDEWQTGVKVNLEVDVIARYLERLLLGDKAAHSSQSNITMDMLAQNGFLR